MAKRIDGAPPIPKMPMQTPAGMVAKKIKVKATFKPKAMTKC